MARFVTHKGSGAAPIFITDTITILDDTHCGAIVVSGSHGGVSSGQFALRTPLAGVFFNDAGIGKDNAGVRGVEDLDGHGTPAVAYAHMSAEIGDGEDAWSNGIVSVPNRRARESGIRSGIRVADAARILSGSRSVSTSQSSGIATPILSRFEREVGGARIVLLDSISMSASQDENLIVVSGSHGGRVSAGFVIAHPPRFVVFNDAGGGRNQAGISCLPILADAGIAAVAVDHRTGRIGDPADILSNGVLSAVNSPAKASGAREGCALRDFLDTLVGSAWPQPTRLRE